MLSGRKTPSFELLSFDTHSEQLANDTFRDALINLSKRAFGLDDRQITDVFSPNSNATFLLFNRIRKQPPHKLAVYAVGYFSPHAIYVPWIVDRSKRLTEHVPKFLQALENIALATPTEATLSIVPNALNHQMFMDRGYTAQLVGGLAFQLTTATYLTRQNTPAQ